MYDFPGIAVFCSESFEYFPGMASKLFFKPFVAIPLAPVIISTILHFMFHIRVSIHKLLYVYLVSFSFLFRAISVRWYCHIYQHACVFLFSHARKIAKKTVSFVMSVCLSIRPSVWDNSVPTGWIFMKFDI